MRERGTERSLREKEREGGRRERRRREREGRERGRVLDDSCK